MIFNPIVPKMEPTTYISSLAVGSSVWFEVNSTRIELLIVQQGNPDTSLYDASCDGTWCLLKDIYSLRVWSSNGGNSYSASDINTWLTQTFSNYLPSIVKTVKIPYVNGYGSTGSVAAGSNGLEVKAFLLSGYELGWLNTDSTYPIDGKKLDYFDRAAFTSTKRVAYYNGAADNWRTRSPDTSDNTNVFGVTSSGNASFSAANGSSGIRPAFILPSDTKIDKDNNIIAPPSESETWVIKDNPTIGRNVPTTNINFTSNGVKFAKIDSTYGQVVLNNQTWRDRLRYTTSDGTIKNVYAYTYNAYGESVSSSWADSAYRTIVFDSPVTNETLLTWLQANATKQ